MPEHADKLLPPVLAAMSSLDDAAAAHDRLTEQLGRAMQEGVRLDEELRGIDFHDEVRLEAAAHAYAGAVATVQRLAFRVKAARESRERAQTALSQARKEQSHARTEMLRIELEIDAASIWDMVGRFEQQVRGRLEEHARIAEEMRFSAAAAGEKGAMALEASTLAPALGTSGPDLWSALAGGVKQLYDKTGALPQLPAKAEPLPAREVAVAEVAPQRAASAVAVETVVTDRAAAPPPRATVPPPLPSRPLQPVQVPLARPIQPAQVLPARPASSVEISAALLQGLPLAVPTPSPSVLARAVTIPADLARPLPASAAQLPPRPARAASPVARPSPNPPAPSEDDTAGVELPARDAPFDFGRPDVARKSAAPLGAFALRPVPHKEASAPPAPENSRGRLDKMLRNLAGMVGPRRGAARRSREK